MRYKAQSQVSKHLSDETKFKLTDDYFFRELIFKIIKEIPIDELKKLFTLTKLDPDKEIENMPQNIELRNILFSVMQEMRINNTILYEAEININ